MPFCLFVSHTCCHDVAKRYETGLPNKGCTIANHVINEHPETAKGKQRVKVSQFFIEGWHQKLILGEFEKVSVKF